MSDYTEVYLTPEMIDKAEAMASDMGRLNRSITNGERNSAGFLGELVFEDWYPEAIRDNTFEHDFIFHGAKVDVKTKVRAYKPRHYYEVSVSAYRLQKADVYFFVSLLEEKNRYTKAYLLGWASKNDFLQNARLMKKGEVDPLNNFKVSSDCYNLEISKLRPVKRSYE
jgi:hypothetical protein